MRDEAAPLIDGGTIAVVDDDDDVRALLCLLLQKSGCVAIACDGAAALRRCLERDAIDAVVLDVMMPGESGLSLLGWLRQHHAPLPVIMLTASPDAQSAVDALKGGAYDYLLKPVRREPLLLAVRNAVEKSRLSRELLARSALDPDLPPGLVAKSAGMRRVVGVIEQVRQSAVPVLLTGESGSGKEVLARHIHHTSKRHDGPFVAVNCAALPRELVESELFGHERGAFTGADKRRRGRFEEASGGTLFLDEIGELPLDVQPKLLRTLQEREVLRVGGDRVAVDVRIVAATNVNLEDAVKRGAFRADLLYRLDVIRLRLPPLRERRDDVVPLAHFLLERFCQEEQRPTPTLTAAAQARLLRWSWPGNVRELDNVLRRSVLLQPGDVLDAAHVLLDDGGDGDGDADDAGSVSDGAGAGVGADNYAAARDAAVNAFERDYLIKLLTSTGGNLAEAARRSGTDRSNLRRVLTRNGLRPEDFRGGA